MAERMSRNKASVAARVRCSAGASQICPISMLPFFGTMLR